MYTVSMVPDHLLHSGPSVFKYSRSLNETILICIFYLCVGCLLSENLEKYETLTEIKLATLFHCTESPDVILGNVF